MEHIVTSIRFAADQRENVYYLLDSDIKELTEAKSSFSLNLYDIVRSKSSLGDVLSDVDFSAASSKEKEKYLLAVKNSARNLSKNTPFYQNEEVNELTMKMLPKLRDSSIFFLSKFMLGAPIIFRFHNDSDGAVGAYSIFKSLFLKGFSKFRDRTAWRMQRGVIYTLEDASTDILFANNFSSVVKPLLVIIDFGTLTESNPGISLANEKFDILWLDHHPISSGFEGTKLEHYINPWLFGGDSDYTAGLLACTFSKIYSNIETSEIEEASLVGDYSRFVNDNKKGKEISELLELVTSDTRIINSKDLSPYEIDEILSNEEKRIELLSYARLHMNEALDAALQAVKVYKSEKSNLYLLDFENVRSDDMRYPLPGRFASKLLSKIEALSDKPCIVVLHFSTFISLRASKSLDIDLIEVAKSAKASFKYVDSAGGHRSAVSIKLKDENSKKAVISFVIQKLGFTTHMA
ncbi:MAG: hypothetical protein ACP5RT_01215 [Candidatus Micrarchaeia archaeon]